jgi:hypothetical protein
MLLLFFLVGFCGFILVKMIFVYFIFWAILFMGIALALLGFATGRQCIE